nr:reverse transcriptase domain-containing protein [Tanacetum cinerariifolium]
MFNEAWERFKDLLRQCPHHGFSELHQLDTFYNALNPNDQDALDSAAGGNFLDKIPRESLSIIESKSKVRYSRSRVTDDKLDIRMNRFEKSLNDMKNSFVTPTVPLKAVEEVCVTCGANDSYNQCPLTRGNDFPVFHDNIQQFQAAAIGNFIQNVSNQMRPPGFNQPNQQNNQSCYQGEAKAITTRSGMTYKEPPISPTGVEQQEPIEETMNTELPSTKDIQPPSVQVEVQKDKPIEEPSVLIPKAKANLPYPSRLEEIDVVSITNDVLPPSDDDSDEEVDAVGDLRVDNFIQNSEHEYSESEDFDFHNWLLPLPPPEPPYKEFYFEINLGNEISVVRNVIVKFECIDARVKFDVFNDENDVLSYFMFVIFAKEFSLLSTESEDTIFDPGISD